MHKIYISQVNLIELNLMFYIVLENLHVIKGNEKIRNKRNLVCPVQ